MAGELQSLLDETRRHGQEPEPEQRGGPERATARDEAGTRGAQELPGRADTARHQPPGEPQGVVGDDNLHDGTGQPDAVDQLAAIRGLRQQAERSLKEGHPFWLQGVRGERGANGQQGRNTAQEDVRLAAARERAALKPAEQAEQRARLARPRRHTTPRRGTGLTR